MVSNQNLDELWRYILTLEDDFIVLTKYIEPIEKNFTTSSIEITKLHNTACSCIATILPDLCRLVTDNTGSYPEVTEIKREKCKSDMEYWKKVLKNAFPNIEANEINVTYLKQPRKPLNNWFLRKYSLDWWNSYNRNKHDQLLSSTFIECVDAISSLFLFYLLFYQETLGVQDAPRNPRPRVFATEKWPGYILLEGGGELIR